MSQSTIEPIQYERKIAPPKYLRPLVSPTLKCLGPKGTVSTMSRSASSGFLGGNGLSATHGASPDNSPKLQLSHSLSLGSLLQGEDMSPKRLGTPERALQNLSRTSTRAPSLSSTGIRDIIEAEGFEKTS